MKLAVRLIALFVTLLCAVALLAAPAPKDKDKEKEKQHDGKNVDSGSFGIFMNGHRVGTETFSIYENGGGSVVTSNFKTVNDPAHAEQGSELELDHGGDIRRYEWKEVSPGKAHASVGPNEEFLLERWSSGPDDKEHEQPYLLAHSVNILDDYFFIHREVLLWKFLSSACKQDQGHVQCPIKQRTQFGTLNPHQHSSSPLTAEYLGRDKIAYKGAQQEFDKVELKTEVGSWFLWFDDQFKIVRIFVEGDNTEVVRE